MSTTSRGVRPTGAAHLIITSERAPLRVQRYACVRHSSTNEALSRDCRRKDCLVYHSRIPHRVLSTQENNDTSSFTPVCGWSSG